MKAPQIKPKTLQIPRYKEWHFQTKYSKDVISSFVVGQILSRLQMASTPSWATRLV